jgi:pimeloyl-ACP methyl ester carboxylesterase
MIYEEPVVDKLKEIKVPTLLIIGQEDRTVVGKDQLSTTQKKIYGNYPVLGKLTKRRIPNARLIELKGVGHIPHIQVTGVFNKHVLGFLNK